MHRVLVLAAAVAALVTACSSPAPGPGGTPPGPTAAPPSAPGGTPAAATPAPPAPASSPAERTPSPPAAAGLAGCPPARPLASVPGLAHLDAEVDDATVTGDGHIWVTAEASGRVLELDGSGRLLRSIADPRGPEGIVPLPGGALALAEQTANRVVRLDPATGALSPLVAVPNPTANAGVDGLAADPARSRLLIPDSAGGRLLSLPLTASGAAAGPAQVLATGLGRPVAAWPEADGSVDVGVESSPGLVRVTTGGAVTPLAPRAGLVEVDEVVASGGLLYVTDLVRHELDAVDPADGSLVRLVTGSAAPQGLALLGDGRLLLVDSSARELAAVAPCG